MTTRAAHTAVDTRREAVYPTTVRCPHCQGVDLQVLEVTLRAAPVRQWLARGSEVVEVFDHGPLTPVDTTTTATPETLVWCLTCSAGVPPSLSALTIYPCEVAMTYLDELVVPPDGPPAVPSPDRA